MLENVSMSRSNDPKALGSWLSKTSSKPTGPSCGSKTMAESTGTYMTGSVSQSVHSFGSGDKSRQTSRSANSSRRSILSVDELSATPISPLPSPASGRPGRNSSLPFNRIGHALGENHKIVEISDHDEDILWEHPLKLEGATIPISPATPRGKDARGPFATSVPRSERRKPDSSQSAQDDFVWEHPLHQTSELGPGGPIPSAPRSPTRRVYRPPGSRSLVRAAPPSSSTPRSSKRAEYELTSGLGSPKGSLSLARQYVSPLPLQGSSSKMASGSGTNPFVPQNIVLPVQRLTETAPASISKPHQHLGRDHDITLQQLRPEDKFGAHPPPREIVLDNAVPWQHQSRFRAHSGAVQSESKHSDDWDDHLSRASSRLHGSYQGSLSASANLDNSERLDNDDIDVVEAQEEEMMRLALELSLADQNSSYQGDFNDSGDGCSLSVLSIKNGHLKDPVRNFSTAVPSSVVSLTSGSTYYVCVPHHSPATSMVSVTPSSVGGNCRVANPDHIACSDSLTSHRIEERSFLGREDMTINSEEEREMLELAMERSLHDGDSVSQLSGTGLLRRDVSLSTVYLRTDNGASDSVLSTNFNRQDEHTPEVPSSRSERSLTSQLANNPSAHSGDRSLDILCDEFSYGSRNDRTNSTRWTAAPQRRKPTGGAQDYGAGSRLPTQSYGVASERSSSVHILPGPQRDLIVSYTVDGGSPEFSSGIDCGSRVQNNRAPTRNSRWSASSYKVDCTKNQSAIFADSSSSGLSQADRALPSSQAEALRLDQDPEYRRIANYVPPTPTTPRHSYRGPGFSRSTDLAPPIRIGYPASLDQPLPTNVYASSELENGRAPYHRAAQNGEAPHLGIASLITRFDGENNASCASRHCN